MKKTTKRKRRVNVWAIFYSIALTGYAVFTLLYTFLIPRDIVKMSDVTKKNAGAGEGYYLSENDKDNDNEENGGAEGDNVNKSSEEGREDVSRDSEESRNNINSENGKESETYSGDADKQGTVITSDSYESSDISININTIREYDTDIYVADIQIKSPAKLLSGLANDSFGRNVTQKTSEIAESYDAIFAVNGDYYGFRDTGYVMRNGYLYRSTKRSGSGNEDLVIYSDGSFEVINESEVSAQELEKAGAVQIYSFGPGLVSKGVISVDEKAEVAQSMNSNPRTAIGMVEPLHYIVVVSDGRTGQSEGLTLYELAQVMAEYGCTEAYNLDGGGSSTMWFNGKIVNNPTSHGKIKERSVSDIVYIKE